MSPTVSWFTQLSIFHLFAPMALVVASFKHISCQLPVCHVAGAGMSAPAPAPPTHWSRCHMYCFLHARMDSVHVSLDGHINTCVDVCHMHSQLASVSSLLLLLPPPLASSALPLSLLLPVLCGAITARTWLSPSSSYCWQPYM